MLVKTILDLLQSLITLMYLRKSPVFSSSTKGRWKPGYIHLCPIPLSSHLFQDCLTRLCWQIGSSFCFLQIVKWQYFLSNLHVMYNRSSLIEGAKKHYSHQSYDQKTVLWSCDAKTLYAILTRLIKVKRTKSEVNNTYSDTILYFPFLSMIYELLCNLQKEHYVLEAPLHISLSLG